MIEKNIMERLLEVQQTIGMVSKSATNPHFKSKFADLNEVLAVCKPELNKHGLVISQPPGKDEFGQFVETRISDSSGVGIACKVYFTEDNIQKIGAAITYSRRFGLKSLLALEEEDDDGETAAGRGRLKSGTQNKTQEFLSDEKEDKARAVSTPVVTKAVAVEGVRPEQKAAVPAAPPKASRDTINKAISAHSQVVLGKKLKTQDELKAMVAAYGAKTKEELKDAQAQELLTKLQGLVK